MTNNLVQYITRNHGLRILFSSKRKIFFLQRSFLTTVGPWIMLSYKNINYIKEAIIPIQFYKILSSCLVDHILEIYLYSCISDSCQMQLRFSL